MFKSFFQLFFIGFVIVCLIQVTKESSSDSNGEKVSSSDLIEKVKKTHSEKSVEYFKEITLSTENGESLSAPYRWTNNVKIWVDGNIPYYLENELVKVVGELNDIINTIEIEIVNNKSESNLIIYFGGPSDFNRYCNPDDKSLASNCNGFFEVGNNNGLIFINLEETSGRSTYQRHILREEVTQSLGLFNDSNKYPESIFYQKSLGDQSVTEYSELDKELIDMLYNE